MPLAARPLTLRGSAPIFAPMFELVSPYQPAGDQPQSRIAG